MPALVGPRAGGDDFANSNTTNDSAHRIGVPPWRGGNRIIASLPDDERSVLASHLTKVDLASGQVLYDQRALIDHVYFPDTAVVSLLSRMENDSVVEVGTIGNEGAVGLGLFLGATVSVAGNDGAGPRHGPPNERQALSVR